MQNTGSILGSTVLDKEKVLKNLIPQPQLDQTMLHKTF